MSYLIIPNSFQSARCLLLTMFDILFLSFSIYRSRVQCVIGIRVETRKLLEDRAQSLSAMVLLMFSYFSIASSLYIVFFYILYGSLDQRNPFSIIDAGEAFGAKSPPTRYNVNTLLPITHCKADQFLFGIFFSFSTSKNGSNQSKQRSRYCGKCQCFVRCRLRLSRTNNRHLSWAWNKSVIVLLIIM